MSAGSPQKGRNKQAVAKRNRNVGLAVLGAVIGMIGLAYASVPLYNIFCRVTGFGGTTQVAEKAPDEVIDREIIVKFTASTERNMPWAFRPDQREVSVNVGERKLISYSAKNMSSIPITGTAVFNVSPSKAGKYFSKIQCFCFENQLLEPNQNMNMPVVFFIDPAIMDDRRLDDLTTVTLSYTFFESESEELEQRLEDSYNKAVN